MPRLAITVLIGTLVLGTAASAAAQAPLPYDAENEWTFAAVCDVIMNRMIMNHNHDDDSTP